MLNEGKNSEPKLNVRSNLNSNLLCNISLIFMLTMFSLSVSAKELNILELSTNGGAANKGMITKNNTNGNAHQIGINCLDIIHNKNRSNALYPENGLIDGNDGYLIYMELHQNKSSMMPEYFTNEMEYQVIFQLFKKQIF